MCDDFPLYRLLVVGAPTRRAEAIQVVLEIVEAKLADLSDQVLLEIEVGADQY